MSEWCSFEEDKKFADNWRQFITEAPLMRRPRGEIPEPEEGGSGLPTARPSPPSSGGSATAPSALQRAKAGLGQARAAGQKAGSGLEKGRQAVAGGWDWISNFLSGKPQDKDYSHLRMPASDRPVATPGEEEPPATAPAPEEDPSDEEAEEESDEEPTPTPRHLQPSTEPPADPERELERWAAETAAEINRLSATDDSDDKIRARNMMRDLTPEQRGPVMSLVHESKTYDRWKVLSGIKKSVI